MVTSNNPAFVSSASINAMNDTQVFALSVEESRALATIVAIYFIYGVWKLSYRINGFDELRRAVAIGNWTWVDGLSANLSLVKGLSRAHLERLLRSVRQEPAIEVPRLDLSFGLTLPVLLNSTSRYLTINYTSKRAVTLHALLLSPALKPLEIASLVRMLHEDAPRNNPSESFPPSPIHKESIVEAEGGRMTAASCDVSVSSISSECVSGDEGTQQVSIRLPTTMLQISPADKTKSSEPRQLLTVPAPTNTAGSKSNVMLLIVCVPSDNASLSSSTASLLKTTTDALQSPPAPAQASRFTLSSSIANLQPKHMDDWVLPYKSGTLYKVGELFGIGYEEQEYEEEGNGDNLEDTGNRNAENAPVEEEEEEEEAPCIVCFTDERDVIFLPCRHRAVCSDCFSHMDTCPVCRSSVREVVKVVATAVSK